MNEVSISEDTIKTIVEKYHGEKSALISILQDVQKEYAFLPKDALSLLSEEMEVPLSRVYEVSTFYNSFSLVPRGRHVIEVCAGTACHVKGGPKLRSRLEAELNIECGETTEDRMFTLEEVRCLGCCSLAPVVKIDSDIYAYLEEDKIPGSLENYRKERRQSGEN
jgi:NADH:ubiquinone oxidoreductase subunit E